MHKALEKASQKDVYLQSLVDKYVWLLVNIFSLLLALYLSHHCRGIEVVS